MIQRITLITIGLFFTAQSHAWVVTHDFEDGKPGNIASGFVSGLTGGFDDAADGSLYSTKHVYKGAQSGSTTIKTGDTGWSRWGGQFNLPTDLGVGDELWWKVALYFPSDFQFDSGGGIGKGMRIKTTSANATGNGGYIDNYFKGTKAGDCDMHAVFNEASGNTFSANNPSTKDGNNCDPKWNNASGFNRLNVGTEIPRDKWVVFEQYVKLSANPDAGIYRMWQDGQLVFEDKKTWILVSPTAIADYTLLFTYWNAGSPKDNTVWVDDVVLTNQRPDNTDSFGNPFLGISGDLSFTTPPKPPSIVKAK